MTTKNQIRFVNLKPAKNTTNQGAKITGQPPHCQPLSISQIDSFPSDAERPCFPSYTTPPPPHQQLQHPNLTNNNSKKARNKLHRIISRRFNTDKPLIQRALSQFLIDEEFDAKAMKTDLKESDGYIIDHLANKFNWDTNTRQQFFVEITDALTEDEFSRKNSNRTGTIYMSDMEDIHEEEEQHKYNSSDSEKATQNTEITEDKVVTLNINVSTPETPQIQPLNDSLYNVDKMPLKSAYSVDTETTVFSNDDNDDVGVSVPRSYTEQSRVMSSDNWIDNNSMSKNKRTRYPVYVIKAIFYAADDEHVEVLLDQAINFIANDPRFNYLWHDEEFIKMVYFDKTFNAAVERLIREIQDIASNDDGADFFHQFVYREYDRERKDYLRNLLSAKENKSYHEKALAQEEHGQFDINNNNNNNNNNYDRVRTQSISDMTINKKYTIKYLPINNTEQNEFDIKFKIRLYKVGDDRNYIASKPTYFELPNRAPDKKFMWAQYQRKKIKRFGKPNKAHGYWKLLRCEEPETEIDIGNKLGGGNMELTAISNIISSPSTRTGEMTELTAIVEETKKKK